MQNLILSLAWQFTRICSTVASLCLVAAIDFGAVAQAQEKPAEAPHAAGWVVIPVEEYRVLRAKAYPTEHDPDPPPVEATLTRVDYDLRVDGELATGNASLTIDVMKDGWVRVPLPDGLLVREARLDGKLVSLVPAPETKGKPHLAALLSHAGRSVLLLDVDVPIASSAGDESFPFPPATLVLRERRSSFEGKTSNSGSAVDCSLTKPKHRARPNGSPTATATSR